MMSDQSPGAASNAAMLPSSGQHGVSSKMLYTLVGIAVVNVVLMIGTVSFVVTKVTNIENLNFVDELIADGVGTFIKAAPKLVDGVAHDVFTHDYVKMADHLSNFAVDITPENCDDHCSLDGQEVERGGEWEFWQDGTSVPCGICQYLSVAGPVVQLVASKLRTMERVESIEEVDNVPVMSAISDAFSADEMHSLMPICRDFAEQLKKPNWDMEGMVPVVTDQDPAYLRVELDETVNTIADSMLDFCQIDITTGGRRLTSVSKGFKVASASPNDQ